VERVRPARSADLVIGVLALVLAGVAAALLLLTGLHLPAVPTLEPHLPWYVLAGLFLAAQAYRLVLPGRRESRVVFLSEIPVVLGLVYCDTGELVVARLLAPLVLYGLVHRVRALKLVFNVAVAAVEVSVALLVARLLLDGGAPLGPRGWVALYAATAASSVATALAVEVAAVLADGDRVGAAALRRSAGEAVATAVLVTTLAVVVAEALLDDAVVAVPLVACGVLLLLAYRAYSALHERHLGMERLYRFSRAIGSRPEVDEVLRSVLVQARELLHAERAEVHFLPEDLARPGLRVHLADRGDLVREEAVSGPAGAWLLDAVVRAGTPVLVARDTRDPRELQFLAAHRMRDAVVVPLRGEVGIVGLLLVGDRLGEIRGFDAGDVRLSETVANHASFALRNGQLAGQLRHDSRHDALTGLPNRLHLHEELESAIRAVAAGTSPGAAVMMMDLDGFKEVNDTLGHQQGDLLLKEVGLRLETTVGDRGVVARLGGDEFAVLLAGCAQPDEAMALAQEVLRALEQPVPLQDIEVDIAASVGVALAPLHAQDASALLKRSDMAMYAAKADQRGVLVYERVLDTSSPHRLALVGELRAALAAGDVQIHVQPQAHLVTGEVQRVEVLARWDHPVHGRIAPDEFIPLAERTGLIRPLTQSVLRQSLVAVAGWRAAGHDLAVAVNLSARSLLDDELEDQVQGLLDELGLPGSALTLEITESSVMSDPARTIRLLERLRARGIRLSVDDFGTGYSSLSYLRQLPIHEVKIDKSFVADAVRDADDQAIVRSIIDLGTNLHLDVVAEGVEDEPVRALLEELGCTLMQGYHLARPMPLSDFLPWYAAHTARLPLAA